MALTKGTGFQFRRSVAGSEVCGTVETFRVEPSHTVMAIGDPVIQIANALTTGRAIAEVDTPTPAQSLVVTRVLGFVAGFEFDPDNLNTTGLPDSQPGNARVIIDRDSVFEADVIGVPLPRASVGKNVDINYIPAVTAGGITTSHSGIATTVGSAATTRPLRVIELLTGSDGVFGSRALVRMNATFIDTGAAGV